MTMSKIFGVMQTRYACPICAWTSTADVNAVLLEAMLRKHVEFHDVLDWVRTVVALKDANKRLREAIKQVTDYDWSENDDDAVADMTALRTELERGAQARSQEERR